MADTQSQPALVRSPHVRVLKGAHYWIAYHSLFGKPTRLDFPALCLLQSFSASVTPFEIIGKFTADEIAAIGKFLNLGFIVADTDDERIRWRDYLVATEEKSDLFSSGVALLLTTKCNFKCSYCIADFALGDAGNLYYQTAVRALESYICNRRRDSGKEFSRFTLVISGGEALLRFDLLKRLVEHLATYYSNLSVHYRIITNGSLVTDEIAEFLSKHDFDVVVSLDGDEGIHDQTRRTKKDGAGTWRGVIAGIRTLRRARCRVTISAVSDKINHAQFSDELLETLAANGVTELAINTIDPAYN